MSTRHTSSVIKMLPATQGSYISPPINSGAYWNEDAPWTEMWANTPGAICIAGFCSPGYISGFGPAELQFAMGAEGEEVPFHTYRHHCGWAVNTTYQHTLFPVPMAGIPANVRLSFRLLSPFGATNFVYVTPAEFSFMYYQDVTTEHKNTAPSKCYPWHTDSPPVYWPVTTPWENTEWFNLTTGEDREITLTDAHHSPGTMHNCAAEMDISIGIPGLEEQYIVTTKRFRHSMSSGWQQRINFPGGIPVIAGIPISYRVRREVIGGSASSFSFNYVYHTQYLP